MTKPFEWPEEVVEKGAFAIYEYEGRDPHQLTYHTVEPGVQEPYGSMYLHFIPEVRSVLASAGPYILARISAAERAVRVAALRETMEAVEIEFQQYPTKGIVWCKKAIQALITKAETDDA